MEVQIIIGWQSAQGEDYANTHAMLHLELAIQQVCGLNAIGALVDRCNADIA